MSAEPGRKTAYAADLRWRMIWQRIALEFPLEKIATNLNIAASTVHRTVKHFEDTGEVEPRRDRAPAYDLRALSPSSEFYVIGLILQSILK